MAVELVKDPVHEYVCDGCGKSTIVVEGEDQPLGIEGTVAEHHGGGGNGGKRSEEHTSELQSLMRISYAVFCLKKKKQHKINPLLQLYTLEINLQQYNAI